MKLKRYWYLTHRWLGITMCLFFAMWFFSGVVMMYVGFPTLERQERLDSLPLLNADKVSKGPAQLFADLLPTDIISLRLTSVANRPVYLVETLHGDDRAVFADTGSTISVDQALAIASAQQFLLERPDLKTGSGLDYRDLVEVDQWSLSKSLNGHRPLHRVALGDEGETELYISSRTGEVVRDVSGNERLWNWLGANLHWIYPVQLRKHASLWADIVITLSLIACFVVITGAVVGIQRLRVLKPYRGKDYSPYRGIAKWHHLIGLAALVFLSTYTFSGLMSMNPWGLFDDEDRLRPQLLRYQFGDDQLSIETTAFGSAEDVKNLLASGAVQELNWHWLDGESYLVAEERNSRSKVFLAGSTEIKNERIASSAMGLLPEANITSVNAIDQYELYYYSHHNRYRPLPVLKVEFDDPHSTWFYIDQKTGQVVERLTRTARVKRWLYNGLHSLDFNVLIQSRPIWDVVVVGLCIVGFIFSLTAVYLGVRRLV